jgi:hypothetical protein
LAGLHHVGGGSTVPASGHTVVQTQPPHAEHAMPAWPRPW